jgi:hypothetical protein
LPLHDLTWRYYYQISAEESIPGSFSYLLSIREIDILEIFKICSFYDEIRGAFMFPVFETWVAASFDTRTVEVTTYWCPELPPKKIPLIKIGVGEHPCPPNSERNANRNKKPPFGTLSYADSWSK